ncbi:uncharacterized protein LOC131653592 isoform X1 [Vicia villosa]|uniref:uncharacterized protein LOC131653592 isoform X1 n=1 Tax=Vicia villosa TaxID=3911 RepID=UPI00273A8B4B|nr:uncharacterized protein LOC131653592 isoform X1 [Vicia villosa]XP_058779771.1 uncharacterized protein LOC131653592 isoform X1 [Vicia villosa]XP_058779772.1 uncharacterized protein LOC131653592 isoform X1 [Vicia villosa]XP_058779773.1 uncharacterized protein LOC131653592 isoform X1 [Vicia villosa]XP_058779774.1 uncharacterized protein LOC131653592 isoform X1 [Vicia villosa]XP_058779775.1 uncharacterized protein LOC131653592 isoform X1 [Vicia villosa]XP_058779776.1 uncharacterized protein LO
MATRDGGIKSSSINGVKMYTIASQQSSLASWVPTKEQSRHPVKSCTQNVQLIEDLRFTTATTKIKATLDSEFVIASGIYPPQVKVYEVREFGLKFERHLDSEIIDFQVLFTNMSAYEDYMTHKATTFGMKSVIYVSQIKSDTVAALSAFCDKATMGVLVAPTLSIGSILLQQAAISASFHYRNVEIVESKDNANDLPSAYANHIANNLFKLGEIYNREEDSSTDVLVLHSLELLQTMPPKKSKKKNISTQHEEVTQPLNFDL